MAETEKVECIRGELSLPDEIIAVNAGSWGPLCNAARKAIERGYEEEANARGDDPEAMCERRSGLTRYTEAIDEAKAVLTGFLNCKPDEVALCDSSTTGMNIFLWGYDYQPGDEIVAGSLENPAAIVPLRLLSKRRGVKLSYADLGNGDRDAVEAITKTVTDNTRMILISDVNFATGSRVDLKEISRFAHELGILVLADGIQAVGTHPVDVKSLEVDGYAMARHKFMCGPDGAGALYVNKEVFPQILPTYSGVFSDADHGMGKELNLMTTAQRYEVSTRPIPVIMGGTACVRWLCEGVGLSFIFNRCRKLYNELWDTLNEINGVEMISQRDQSSLMTFAISGLETRDVVARLREQYVFTRTIVVTEPSGVRLSIGAWSRESDLERIAEMVRVLARRA
jgi:L-cysteine/cystine lyase